jgi:hypothetical protein
MELLADIWQWIFSGIGIPLAGWLWLRFRRNPSAQPDTIPSVSNTFTNSGKGDQNIAQGENAVAKQVNVTQHITGNGNIVSGSGDVKVRR